MATKLWQDSFTRTAAALQGQATEFPTTGGTYDAGSNANMVSTGTTLQTNGAAGYALLVGMPAPSTSSFDVQFDMLLDSTSRAGCQLGRSAGREYRVLYSASTSRWVILRYTGSFVDQFTSALTTVGTGGVPPTGTIKTVRIKFEPGSAGGTRFRLWIATQITAGTQLDVTGTPLFDLTDTTPLASSTADTFALINELAGTTVWDNLLVYDLAVTSTVTGVTIAPTTASVAGNATQTFVATVAGTLSPSQAVAWTTTAGAVTSGGIFTSPVATGTAQTITVTATSTQDATKSGTATVTVPAVTVAITAAGGATSVAAGSTLQLTATGGTAYTWTVTGGGTVSTTGLYTPPASGSGTAVIRATDTTGATNTISIGYSAGVGISLTAGATINQLATLSVTATVINAASTAVTFSGTAAALLTGSGVTQTLTAPASTTAQTYTLIATSVQDTTKTATSVFSVPAVSVTVTSTTANCQLAATVSVGVATVAGSTNTGVTYTTPDGGTYSAGTFTPPGGAVNGATYRVVSTAVADTTKTATITVTMTSLVTTYALVPLGAENTGLTVLTVQIYNPATGAAVGTAQTPTIVEVALGSNTASGTFLVPVTGVTGVTYLVTYANATGTVSTQDTITMSGGSVAGGLTTAQNTALLGIKTQTDLLATNAIDSPNAVTAQSTIAGLAVATATAVATRALTGTGWTSVTIEGALKASWANGLGNVSIVGTALTLYAPDGTTVLKTFTLNSATTPTSRG